MASRTVILLTAGALAVAGCTAASAHQGGLPSPTPAEMQASGTVSVFPMPGTETASPATTISFRGALPAEVRTVAVFGSETGTHRGHLLAHSDGRGASFVPDQPFAPGETVTVTTNLRVRGGTRGDFSFDVAQPAPAQPTSTGGSSGSPPPTPAPPQHFASRPDLQPPALRITTGPRNTALGPVFLTANPSGPPPAGAPQSGPMIVNGRGQLVWFDPRPGGTTFDLAVQQYRGRPVLTYFDGQIQSGGYGTGSWVMLDDAYREIARVHAGNGYQADIHDFLVTPQNTALILVYNPVYAKASTIDRPRDRAVLDAVVQEIDIPTGAVLFEWHSIGTVRLDESYVPAPTSTEQLYDYMHENSVELDRDGNVWLSARHTSTIYKIDRETGALYWRLGGKRNNFSMGPNTTFGYQHDVVPHADGTVSLFDNAASEPGTEQRDRSRGMVLDVDQTRLRATLARSDDNPQRVLSYSQGSYEVLANGDWFAGWGSVPQFTEYGPGGDVRLNVEMLGGPASYRAFRFVWHARPQAPPALVARRVNGSIELSASWNGATDVAGWRVLAGSDAGSLAPVGTFVKHGFETTMTVPAGAAVFEVQAVGPQGHVQAASKAVSAG